MNKMKKLLIIILGMFLIGFVFEGIIANKSNVYKEQKVGSIKKNKKLLSINLEQTAGAGDYKTVTQSNWPTDGYVFNEELSKCENGSTLSWDDTNKKVIVSGSLTDKCYVYFDKILTLAEYVMSQYTGTQGENGIYYHNSSLANGAEDNSYRYAGASDSVNNYICLGSDTATCPDANLFRIIGVFGGQIKIIRAKSIGNKYWDTNRSNTWSTSSLNAYLNGEYLTSLGTIADKIATTTWKVGGVNINITSSVPKKTYQYEVGSSASSTTYESKIGLLYVSDYEYGASLSAWTLVGWDTSDATKDYRSATSINWLYLGSDEWTISPLSGLSGYAILVKLGRVGNSRVQYGSYAVRPSFNLESTVAYVSGSGTQSDPIRIN